MKKNLLLLVVLSAVLVFTSCNKNLTALDGSYFKTNPNPLVEQGGEVNATVTGVFPEKYFNKKAVVTVTPVLKYDGGEVKSTSTSFQGEKVLDNNQLINYKYGGNYSINPKFEYIPELAKSELFLKFDVTRKKKSYKLPDVKIADGVMATSQLAALDASEISPALAPDNFERITYENTDADILFLIQQAQLRNTELTKENVQEFNEKLKEARHAQNKEVSSLQVLGYASPDGPIDLNTSLAERRQKVTTDYVNKELKKLESNVKVDSKFTPEDWDGFQKLMESSDIQDKDLILRVLSMYQDPEQREREIKNLASAFNSIADEILPQLRRSRLKMTVDVTGKSDVEILDLAASNPSALTANELLYAGTLASTNAEQTSIYEKFTKVFAQDARGYNNLGVMRYYEGNIDEANQLFDKALQLDPNSKDANFNKGLVQLSKRAVTEAQTYFGKSVGTVGDLGAALGTSYILQGNYSNALNSLGKTNSNNAALAQILNNDYNGARATLAAIKVPNALTAYLNAVLAARTNDRDAVFSHLRNAISLDRDFALRAAKDLEFSKYFTDSNFISILK